MSDPAVAEDEDAESAEVDAVAEAEVDTAEDESTGAEDSGIFEDEAVSEGTATVVEEGWASAEVDDAEAEDEVTAPDRQLESLDSSMGTFCLYLNSPVESLTWKNKVSEPAARLTFQAVESPLRPPMVSRIVELW